MRSNFKADCADAVALRRRRGQMGILAAGGWPVDQATQDITGLVLY